MATQDHQRAPLSRDLYGYMHVPLVVGIVFAAVGIHEVLVHSHQPLDPVFAAAFAGAWPRSFARLAAIRVRRGERAGLPA